MSPLCVVVGCSVCDAEAIMPTKTQVVKSPLMRLTQMVPTMTASTVFQKLFIAKIIFYLLFIIDSISHGLLTFQ